MKKYLTENTVKNVLNVIYPNKQFIQNRAVPNSTLKSRPDFRNDELKLIIEFDGYLHYSKSSIILNDQIKDLEYKKMGYSVIRIPYFVQISNEVVENLFKTFVNLNQEYPHGFIDNSAMLPSDYCELGLRRFVNDLDKFSYIKNYIIKSLKDKIKQHNNINLVLPPSLHYLVG